MMQKQNTAQGFSLIEMVVAIGIFLVLGSGITFFATGSYSSFTGTGDTGKKERFAQDAIEALEIIQERNWTQIDSNDAGNAGAETGGVRIDKDVNGDWVITAVGNGVGETRGSFTRYIYISTALRDASTGALGSGVDDPATKKVEVVIRATGQADYKLETYLTSWDSLRMDQTVWSGATSTSVWSSGWTNWEYQSNIDVPTTSGRLELSTTTI